MYIYSHNKYYYTGLTIDSLMKKVLLIQESSCMVEFMLTFEENTSKLEFQEKGHGQMLNRFPFMLACNSP